MGPQQPSYFGMTISRQVCSGEIGQGPHTMMKLPSTI